MCCTPRGVFPAHAGMFRLRFVAVLLLGRFPRVCGDVPLLLAHPGVTVGFSPRMRGCSGWENVKDIFNAVFPAYAGMFLGLNKSTSADERFPRVCGDVPFVGLGGFYSQSFSPRMRGCSGLGEADCRLACVFPAYAGMFPPTLAPIFGPAGFPRVCGDVPPRVRCDMAFRPFSPHTRGCSEAFCLLGVAERVFPAYAGMLRQYRKPGVSR